MKQRLSVRKALQLDKVALTAVAACIVCTAVCLGSNGPVSGASPVDEALTERIYGGACAFTKMVPDTVDQCKKSPNCFQVGCIVFQCGCNGNCITCGSNPNDKIVAGTVKQDWTTQTPQCAMGIMEVCPAKPACTCGGQSINVGCGTRVTFTSKACGSGSGT